MEWHQKMELVFSGHFGKNQNVSLEPQEQQTRLCFSSIRLLRIAVT